MQKTDHSQFTSFVLSEFEQIPIINKPANKTYLLWVGSLLVPIIALILSVFNGGEIDRVITASLYNLFESSAFFIQLAQILQYALFIPIGGVFVCLILVILYLNPNTREKFKSVSSYAILFLLVGVFSLLDHFVLQIVVNRVAFDPIVSSLHPFYRINPSFSGLWNSSFPNNNVLLSSLLILLPVIFGNRSAAFKWIMGIISGVFILATSLTEIGLSRAWFSDVFISIGIVLFWGWFVYWHVLFIKDSESTKLVHKLTDLYYRAYNILVSSKNALESNNVEDCKQKLIEAKNMYNLSISSLQNHSGDVSKYITRNEFWKSNINLLLKELENSTSPSKKWLYIF